MKSLLLSIVSHNESTKLGFAIRYEPMYDDICPSEVFLERKTGSPSVSIELTTDTGNSVVDDTVSTGASSDTLTLEVIAMICDKFNVKR